MSPRKTDAFDDPEISRLLWEALDKQKGYASFFDWPDKAIKERSVVKDLLYALQIEERICWIRSLKSNPVRNVAPDCIGIDVGMRPIAIEVTELVDQATVERNRKGHADWKEWGTEEFRATIRSKLKNKDGKQLHGGPFDSYVVVLHTDEPLLSQKDCAAMLDDQKFGPFEKIKEAFLLFSHVPRRVSYPYIRLKLL